MFYNRLILSVVLLFEGISAFTPGVISLRNCGKVYDSSSYLDQLNKTKPKDVLKAEDGARRNTDYNAAKKIDFDKLFLNIGNIASIYVSSDYDRAVFIFKSNDKHVFYIHNKDDKDLIDKIISYRQTNATNNDNVKVIVIGNKNIFTDSFGHLFCEDK